MDSSCNKYKQFRIIDGDKTEVVDIPVPFIITFSWHDITTAHWLHEEGDLCWQELKISVYHSIKIESVNNKNRIYFGYGEGKWYDTTGVLKSMIYESGNHITIRKMFKKICFQLRCPSDVSSIDLDDM